MLIAGVSSKLAGELGLCSLDIPDVSDRLLFGELESLVSLMQETPLQELQRKVLEKFNSGVELKTIVTAAALANARTFGGQDYDGYHTFMALSPALAMSRELPLRSALLPVLKVLYRNTARIQKQGGHEHEVLHPIAPDLIPDTVDKALWLQSAARSADFDRAERSFAALAADSIGEAYNHLQFTVQDEVDVHRIVLAWRAWEMLDIAGLDYAHTLLRQSVRYCVDTETKIHAGKWEPSPIRTLLPKLLDEHSFPGRALGDIDPGEKWVDEMARTICLGSPEEAATLTAAALAEGISSEVIGEVLSLAATRLLLHDRGLQPHQASAGRPAGSVHGASVGVHAADSANAWRNIARVTNARNQVASLIVGAYHTAGRGGQVAPEPIAFADASKEIEESDKDRLLAQMAEAIRGNEQLQTCAMIDRWRTLGYAAEPVFKQLLEFAVSEDGALHAEKFFRTVQEEFATTRSELRWNHLIGLGRVTASEFGHPAPGMEEARELLGIG
jgi:hypothetical protein